MIHKQKLICVAIVGLAAVGAFPLSAQESKSQWDGVYTVEQATRGEARYMKRCSVCHRPDLLGTPEDMYNPAPDLVSASFGKTWNDFTLKDLFEKIQTTMPQDDPGKLSAQETADILAFILQKGNYPAGTAELPTQIESLKLYKFLEKKPDSQP